MKRRRPKERQWVIPAIMIITNNTDPIKDLNKRHIGRLELWRRPIWTSNSHQCIHSCLYCILLHSLILFLLLLVLFGWSYATSAYCSFHEWNIFIFSWSPTAIFQEDLMVLQNDNIVNPIYRVIGSIKSQQQSKKGGA